MDDDSTGGLHAANDVSTAMSVYENPNTHKDTGFMLGKKLFFISKSIQQMITENTRAYRRVSI